MSEFVEDCWGFQHDGLRGYVRGDGHHGIELTAGPDQEPVTRVMNLNLEHYVADDRGFGRFVPREHASVSAERAGTREVRIHLSPTDEWPVRATVTIRLRENPPRTIEATYEFEAEDEIEGFEAFVSNYCQHDQSPVLRVGDDWVRSSVEAGEHRFWLQSWTDPSSVRTRYPAPFMGLDVAVANERLDAPTFLSPVPGVDRYVVRAVEPEALVSVSANRRFNAHDFSLVGRDLQAGESVSCRSWLTYVDEGALPDVLDWFDRVRTQDDGS